MLVNAAAGRRNGALRGVHTPQRRTPQAGSKGAYDMFKSPHRRISLRAAALAAMLALPLAAPAPAQDEAATPDPDAVVGTINGEPITNRDITFAIGDLEDQLAQVPPQQQRFAAMMALIDIELLADKAESEGIAETEAFRQRLDFLRSRALHNSYFRSAVADTISDEDVRTRYDEEIAATPPENEIRARHILLETEEDARAVIEELEAGADFAELAAERSTGPTGPRGGDLGYFTRGRMVPAFDEAAFSLEPGSYTTEPVQTEFGWHVIKLEDRRPVQPPPFEQVEAQVRSVLLRERYFELLESLREEASVEITDPELQGAYDAAVGAGVTAPADASE